MPDNGGRRKRGQAWTLSNAHDVGQLVRITCQYCNIKRDYRPADLQQLVGDISCELVAQGMRCDRCKRADFLVAVTWSPTAQELVGLRIRRLVEIKNVRKVVWRDETSS